MIIVALCAVCAPAAAASTVTGQLQEMHGHRLDGSVVDRSWRVVAGTGIHTLSDRQPAELVGRTVTLTDGDPQTRVVEGRVRATASRAAVAPAGGPRSVLVLIVTTPDATTPAASQADVRARIFGESASPRGFFEAQSNGDTTLTGLVNPAGDVAQVAIAQPLAGCDYRAVASSARAAADAQGWNTAAYTHRIYLHPTTPDCKYGGLGSTPGRDVWSNGYLNWSLVSHELGHNMGAHHASTLDCTDPAGDPVPLSGSCVTTEYGDPFDVMGVSGGLMGAWHRSQVGQLGTPTTSLRQSDSLTLSSVDGAPVGLQNLLVPIKEPRVPVTQWYALDFRSARTPFNWFLTGHRVTTGITIRLVPALHQHTQTRLINTGAGTGTGLRETAPLQPGETFTDAAHNITIRARATGGATIGVDVTMPVLVDDVPPGAVGFLSASGDTNAVSLSWGAATDDERVDHYAILRDGTPIGVSSGLSFTDTGTASVVSATYEVVAVDPTGNRGPAVGRHMALRDVSQPSAVESLTASATQNGVSLSWAAASDNRGVTGYRVMRDGVFAGAPTATSFSERPAPGAHSYTVEAVDAAGNRGAAAAAGVTMPAPESGPGTTTTTPGVVPSPSSPGTTTTTTTPGIVAPGVASVRGAVIKTASRRTRRLSGGRRRITIAFTCSRASTMRVYFGGRRVTTRTGSRAQVTFTLARRQTRSIRVRADFADGHATRRLVVR